MHSLLWRVGATIVAVAEVATLPCNSWWVTSGFTAPKRRGKYPCHFALVVIPTYVLCFHPVRRVLASSYKSSRQKLKRRSPKRSPLARFARPRAPERFLLASPWDPWSHRTAPSGPPAGS